MATRTPVLVVGGGVTGAVLALELARHAVPSLVVERTPSPPGQAGMDLVEPSGMQMFRRLGLSAAIRTLGPDPDRATDVVWSRRLDEQPVFVTQCPSVNQLRERHAHADGYAVIAEQHQWVPHVRLVEHLRGELLRNPLVDLRAGWTFTDLRIEPDRAVATLIDVDGGARHRVDAEYLVGCDGARSTVRRCVGIELKQLRAPTQHCSVQFRTTDDRLPPCGQAPSTIVGDTFVLVCSDGSDVWTGHLRLHPEEPMTAEPEAMLHERLGIRPESAEVIDVTQWDDSLAVAATYNRGRVFLAGESAHRFYPLDSLDASIGDAVDLGWRLAAVISGWGGHGLMNSYGHERRARALMHRELIARRLESSGRFGRLAAAGAPPDFLAWVLGQELAQLENGGLDGQPCGWSGGRAPAIRLADGSHLIDRLGPQLTLVDLTPDAAGAPLVAAAQRRGIPMTHLASAPEALAHLGAELVLVRPDQHMAWRDDDVPADWNTVLDTVCGLRDHVST